MRLKEALVRHKKVILLILILLLAARVFIPQMDVLAESIQTLSGADLQWVFLAIIFYFTGIPVLAAQFIALSFKRLTYALTLRVQAATLFVNKILPQGVGTISLNIYYFIKKGHTPNQATAVVTMNAIASTSAYIVLIIVSLLYSNISVSSIFDDASVRSNSLVIAVLFIVGALITLMNAKELRKSLAASWSTFKKNIASYRTRPKEVLINTVLNGIGTSLNILALIACAKALGVEISFADALIAYTFGNIAATLVPTPGGLGSAEMGIYSGLVIAGLDPTMAMSVTLLYRLVSYWIPILPGYYFFSSLRKTLFAGYSVKAKPSSASSNA